MFKLAWLTDIHLNLVKIAEAPKIFGQYLIEETGCDAAVITGDIAEGPTTKEVITNFSEGFGKPVYFVFGNHDYYRSSIRTISKMAAKLPNYLTSGMIVELTPTTALIGHDGWYDAILGDPFSDFFMSDWEVIKEYRKASRRHERKGIVQLSRELGLNAVKKVRPVLEKALESFDLVILATHIPPFAQSALYNSRISSPKSKPWYTSKMMGDMFLEVMHARSHKRLLVLCGHTHHSADYQPLSNLRVLTGRAVYHAPELAGMLKITEKRIMFNLKTEIGWTKPEPF